jgi:CDP-glycerol glycerophosphotransferase (TagB/SpsB family)
MIEKYSSQTSITRIIYLIPLDELPENKFIFSRKTIFVKRRSAKGVLYYMFSKYVFITHGLYYFKFPQNQISVNLWHGMPLKKLGVEKGNKGLKTSFTISTSSFFNKSLADAFNIDETSIITSNLPRNFKLLDESNDLNLKKIFSQGKGKIVVWLPTYRASVEGDIRIDGKDYGNVVNLPDFDSVQFNEFLKVRDIICYVKPHPMTNYKSTQGLSNFKIVDDNWLYARGFTLYDLLSQADMLISDVSSVIVDYLILTRPILFCFSDQKEYGNSRGLTSNFLYENLPGELCGDYNGLLKGIMNFSDNIDQYSNERDLVAKKFHDINDKSYLYKFLDDLINNKEFK